MHHSNGARNPIPVNMPPDMSMRFAGLLLALFFSSSVFSQNFPQKPVRIIVPFPPGGGADALARILSPRLAELWTQQVTVENKPGASGHIGAEFVAQSPADGHTLLMSSTASLTEKNVSQFAPVTLVSASAYVVVVNSKIRFNNVAELITFARANPGKLTYGSSGAGAASHLSAELFKSMAQVDLLHVPYKGTGQALTDLLAGQVDLMFAPSQTVISHVRGGKLKALAVTDAKRSEILPELPTVAESGLPGYEAVGWFGLLAPVRTPAAIVEKLSADANKALGEPEVKQQMAILGAEPSGGTPAQFARFIHDDQAKWSKLMKERGIVPE
jgi:tripartite-type tricarboxylate transporter receptor subunit TctC